jgi:hypothetical protein
MLIKSFWLKVLPRIESVCYSSPPVERRAVEGEAKAELVTGDV